MTGLDGILYVVLILCHTIYFEVGKVLWTDHGCGNHGLNHTMVSQLFVTPLHIFRSPKCFVTSDFYFVLCILLRVNGERTRTYSAQTTSQSSQIDLNMATFFMFAVSMPTHAFTLWQHRPRKTFAWITCVTRSVGVSRSCWRWKTNHQPLGI